MWTWVTEDAAERDRVLADVLAQVVRRDLSELAPHLCIGSAAHCAEVLSRYARAGCERVYLWPLGDERRQLELVAERGGAAGRRWGEQDSNLRRLSHVVYSHAPLTARESPPSGGRF